MSSNIEECTVEWALDALHDINLETTSCAELDDELGVLISNHIELGVDETEKNHDEWQRVFSLASRLALAVAK